MLTINKHMNLWSDSFRGYCGKSYAFASDVNFDGRPSNQEVEYRKKKDS
jgi:hypothetical protein